MSFEFSPALSSSLSNVVAPNVLVSFMSHAIQTDDITQLRSCLDYLLHTPGNKTDYHHAIHQYSMLTLAAEGGHFDSFKVLHQAGVTDEEDYLSLAVSYGHYDIIEYCLNHRLGDLESYFEELKFNQTIKEEEVNEAGVTMYRLTPEEVMRLVEISKAASDEVENMMRE